jgi:uncharacterized protein
MPTLASIRLYPIKSLDGIEVPAADVLAQGPLRHDRRFALVDDEGRWINGKRTPRLHQIRCEFDSQITEVRLGIAEDELQTFSLVEDRHPLEAWLSEALDQRVRVVEDKERAFPDDPDASGPTVVSRGSLVRAASWFDGLDEEEMHRRMRVNLVFDDCEPFWEDRLVAETPVVFELGGARFAGVNACARCVVPTRGSRDGQPREGFRDNFSARRRQELPKWAAPGRFDHFFRFTVNTVVRTAGRIEVGDQVRLGTSI